MSLAALLNRSCTIQQRTVEGTLNAYNSPVTVLVETVTVCELQQRQRTETTDRGEVSETDWLLVVPAGTSIGTGDTVIVDGDQFEVHGDPWPARNPRTRTMSHIEATLKRTAAADDSEVGS